MLGIEISQESHLLLPCLLYHPPVNCLEKELWTKTTMQMKIRNHRIALNIWEQHLLPACLCASQKPHQFRKAYVPHLCRGMAMSLPSSPGSPCSVPAHSGSICSDFCLLTLLWSPAERGCCRDWKRKHDGPDNFLQRRNSSSGLKWLEPSKNFLRI